LGRVLIRETNRFKTQKTMRVRKRKRELKRDRTHTRRELGVSSVFDVHLCLRSIDRIHMQNQIDETTAVSKLVIVPGDEFNE